MLLAATLAGGIFVLPAGAQSATPPSTPPAKPATASAPTRYEPNHFPKRAAAYYGLFWGVDSLTVKAVEAGELIRFSYRVLDADKAKLLNDKDIEPALILPSAHASFEIPSLEKVGKLRQTATPVAGKSYWMAFSNPSRQVKRGDRVNIIIGNFHADGLIVE
jgi:hypothetical protein